MYAGPTNAYGCLDLTIGHMTIYNISWHTASIISGTTTDFGRLHEIRLGVNYDSVEFTIPVA